MGWDFSGLVLGGMGGWGFCGYGKSGRWDAVQIQLFFCVDVKLMGNVLGRVCGGI